MEYRDYLHFLSDLHQEMNRLIQVGQKKIEAVQSHDLDALNACIRQEQAISLSLRGMEQRRQNLLAALEMSKVPLREMPNRCPEAFREETSRLVEQILKDYQIIESIQTPARAVMEQELRMIHSELEARGVEQELDDNYQVASASRPAELRTDIRA